MIQPIPSKGHCNAVFKNALPETGPQYVQYIYTVLYHHTSKDLLRQKGQKPEFLSLPKRFFNALLFSGFYIPAS